MKTNSTGMMMILVLVACMGCANTQVRSQAGDGVQVETLRVEYNNVHVVRTGEGVVIVDSGDEKDARDLVELIKARGVQPGQVEGILLTHGHPDHVGGARALARAFKAPIIAGRGDEAMLARGGIDHEHDEFCPTSFFSRSRAEKDGSLTFSPFVADHWVAQSKPLGEVLEGARGQIIAQSSHTPGSLVWVVGEAAFVGDLFRGAIVGKSAETHFYMCDLKKNREEIAALMAISPPIKTFFTGHFGPVSRERVQAYLDELP